MNRRGFLAGLVATAGGLLLPHEPRRVYSFARELRVPGEAESAFLELKRREIDAMSRAADEADQRWLARAQWCVGTRERQGGREWRRRQADDRGDG